MKKNDKCHYEKNGNCYASVCLFSHKCKARDSHGEPKYVLKVVSDKIHSFKKNRMSTSELIKTKATIDNFK